MIRNIKHFLRLTFLYITTRILYIFNKPPRVLSSIESLKKLNDEKLSISRYGDGEFLVMGGRSIKFQEYNPLLARRLKEILFTWGKNFYPCIPSIYKFNETRCFLSGKNAASLGYSPLIGSAKHLFKNPVCLSTLKTTTVSSPAVDDKRYS